VLLVLFPIGIDGLNAKEHRDSFKAQMKISEDRSIRELSDYFLSNGLNPLKTTMSKKFHKSIHELVVQYYHAKKANIKRK